MAGNREIVQRRTFAKGFNGNFSVFLGDVVAEPGSDLVDLGNSFGRNASIADRLYGRSHSPRIANRSISIS